MLHVSSSFMVIVFVEAEENGINRNDSWSSALRELIDENCLLAAINTSGIRTRLSGTRLPGPGYCVFYIVWSQRASAECHSTAPGNLCNKEHLSWEGYRGGLLWICLSYPMASMLTLCWLCWLRVCSRFVTWKVIKPETAGKLAFSEEACNKWSLYFQKAQAVTFIYLKSF